MLFYLTSKLYFTHLTFSWIFVAVMLLALVSCFASVSWEFRKGLVQLCKAFPIEY